ncbi:hypothetical protein [Pseudochrobactrum sp. AO18b]|uniref:plasmid mobilization protein n=1 Tax=Pseudochrobactrum sp. AO18b TaxID=1201036 RepID=UPI0003A85881|nr:hypothetical protein [Pseudochrobactrum sp. AO18b]
MRSDVAMPDYIRIRVFPDEKQHLKEAAQKRGISLSELIRSKTLPAKDCEVAA